MSELKDLTGLKIGRLLVLRRVENHVQENGRTRTRWECLCDCGKTCIQGGEYLKRKCGHSCGCLKNEKAAERMHARKGKHGLKNNRSKDLTGKVFGKLTVIEKGEYVDGGHHTTWKCRCECGKIIQVRQCHLITGAQKSCGCENSKLELAVYKYLTINKINFIKEYSFEDLLTDKNKRMRFDFAILNNENLLCLIECQGLQHDKNMTSDFGKQQRETTDTLKKEYCENHCIKLYEIWYNENVEEKLKNILLELNVMSTPCQTRETSEV